LPVGGRGDGASAAPPANPAGIGSGSRIAALAQQFNKPSHAKKETDEDVGEDDEDDEEYDEYEDGEEGDEDDYDEDEDDEGDEDNEDEESDGLEVSTAGMIPGYIPDTSGIALPDVESDV